MSLFTTLVGYSRCYIWHYFFNGRCSPDLQSVIAASVHFFSGKDMHSKHTDVVTPKTATGFSLSAISPKIIVKY